MRGSFLEHGKTSRRVTSAALERSELVSPLTHRKNTVGNPTPANHLGPCTHIHHAAEPMAAAGFDEEFVVASAEAAFLAPPRIPPPPNDADAVPDVEEVPPPEVDEAPPLPPSVALPAAEP